MNGEIKPESNRIPGIPTKHKGRQFRSRLEARWATFFDLLGWKYEYEPFDLDGWIPDFLLMGGDGILVEIKPVVSFPEDCASKIVAARPRLEVLLVGCTVEIPELNTDSTADDEITFGWLLSRWCTCDREDKACECGSDAYQWDTASFGQWGDFPSLGPVGFSAVSGAWGNRIGPGGGKYYYESGRVSVLVRRLWTEAGNQVQWRAPR